ncbi:MAG: hypothetical protein LBJ15_14680 [Comamonas sp.]|jgi:hypothetical protein|uniref:hypothetical protein n=1 Tax=Comamonas sp. TaxID=34028 RepID=UPI0028185DF3|nr:hypothetical protein [Comamonas sp.]MDR0215237.1 hypothetical protein [Comamonas sp.]
MQCRIQAAESVRSAQTLPANRIGTVCSAILLLSACASAPMGKVGQTDDANLQVSALEASGPLQLPFDSAYRWLNFPMYHNDTAHAVDLGALRWRPDTLLQTASRYPLHGSESWPKELYSRAWYVYAKRLVDCQTGHDAEISEALLDRNGQLLLERPAQSAPRMMTDRRDGANRWLGSSEIGLACLAAGDPKLLDQRREAARQPAPRLSYLPISAQLQDDAGLLRSKLSFQIDLAKLQAAKPGGTSAMLADIARQRAQWQRELHGPGSEPQSAAVPWPDAATRKALEDRINAHHTLLPFKALPNGEYERWEDVRRPEPVPKPPEAMEADALRDAEVVALRRGSCLSGSALSTQYRWYGWRSGELLGERAASFDESLASIQPADDFCQQLSALASSMDGSQDKGSNANELYAQVQSRVEQLMKAEQTPEVRAQILLTLRKLQTIDGVQQ